MGLRWDEIFRINLRRYREQIRTFGYNNIRNIIMKLRESIDKRYTKIAVYAIITAVIIFVLCMILSISGGFFKKLFDVIGLVIRPIITGGIIAYLFEPLIQNIEKSVSVKSARLAAVIITTLLMAAIFAGAVFLIAVMVQNQANKVTIDPENIKSVVGSLGLQIDEITTKIQNWLSENSSILGDTFGKITGIFGSLSGVASNLFFSVIFGFYFLLDSKNIGAYWSRILNIFVKPESREKVQELIRDADRCFSGYIRGKLLDALIVFAMVSIAMFICGIPYSFIIGLMTALGNLIPFVGPIGGLIALLVICLSENLMSKFILAAVVLILLMQIDANVINPRLMSRSIAIHPLLVFTAMIAGGAVGGIVGMLVSAPIAAWLKIEFDKYVDQLEKKQIANQKIGQ